MGGNDVQSESGLSKQFQQPVQQDLGRFLTNALSGPQPFQPSTANLPQVFDPAVTQRLFEQQFLTPTLNQFTGPGGLIPQAGAQAAQRGVFFSSGRQQTQGKLAAQAGAQIGAGFAGLVGQDQAVAQQEFLRRQPLTSPLTRQALNFLGIPMTSLIEQQKDPTGQIIGALAGAAIGGFVPGGSVAGAGLGAQLGGTVGGAF